jgi:radical SAM superfamily enzyme YgiQ (UPF0313 family)
MSEKFIPVSEFQDRKAHVAGPFSEKRVVLVNPTRTGGDSYVTPPLHLVYVATAIKAIGHKVTIIDLHYEYQNSIGNFTSVDEFESRRFLEISRIEMDFLGIGGIPSSFHSAKNLTTLIKSIKPDLPVIIGGNMSMPLLDNWFNCGVDFVVESDGEQPISDFLLFWPDTEKISSIPGVYRRGEQGFLGSPPKYSKSLDHIPFPDWSLLPKSEEYFSIFKKWTNRILPPNLQLGIDEMMMPIVMTRGCPYECTFCYHVTRRYRKHSVKYVIDYLKYMKINFGITHVFTWDDLIMVDKGWLSDLCDALIYEKLNIKIFTSGGKPDLVTREVLRKMRSAGFLRVSYGIESGSQEILDEMKKKTTVQQNHDSVVMATQEGLFVHLNMIVGMPGETLESLLQTTSFLVNLAKSGVVSSKNLSFSFATGYPGTELYELMKERGLVSDTEDYLKNQAGLGNYKYNLCGIPQRLLKLLINFAFLRVDLAYHTQRGDYLSAAKSTVFIFAKAGAALILPARALVALRNIVIRNELLQEESESASSSAC